LVNFKQLEVKRKKVWAIPCGCPFFLSPNGQKLQTSNSRNVKEKESGATFTVAPDSFSLK